MSHLEINISKKGVERNEGIQKERKKVKSVSIFLKTLAYGIPVVVLLIILYLNFTPFGFDDYQVIDVGSPADTRGRFYLEEGGALGSRQEIDGEPFRMIDGTVYAIYKPKAVLRDTLQ
jgi:hypothetical protein